ncbi:MAG: hypothetical protein RIQ56_840, partial [Candidatus Parcubacteria bacterium]
GMMKDNKLKKGQLRIIVIATGFPEQTAHLSSDHSSLFSIPTERRQEERGKIYNEVLKRPEPIVLPAEIEDVPPHRIEKSEPVVTAEPKMQHETPKPPTVEEEESWGAIPAFLRRHKK